MSTIIFHLKKASPHTNANLHTNTNRHNSHTAIRTRWFMLSFPLCSLVWLGVNVGVTRPEAAKTCHWKTTDRAKMDTGFIKNRQGGWKERKGLCSSSYNLYPAHIEPLTFTVPTAPTCICTEFRETKHIRKCLEGNACTSSHNC